MILLNYGMKSLMVLLGRQSSRLLVIFGREQEVTNQSCNELRITSCSSPLPSNRNQEELNHINQTHSALRITIERSRNIYGFSSILI